jgi:hypothetical protein
MALNTKTPIAQLSIPGPHMQIDLAFTTAGNRLGVLTSSRPPPTYGPTIVVEVGSIAYQVALKRIT